jgi:hypothetical protein
MRRRVQVFGLIQGDLASASHGPFIRDPSGQNGQTEYDNPDQGGHSFLSSLSRINEIGPESTSVIRTNKRNAPTTTKPARLCIARLMRVMGVRIS